MTYIWETLAWTYSGFICTSVHRKAHNAWHHDFTNGPRDPDRRQTIEEVRENPADGRIAEWIFPNSKHSITSAFFGLWLVNAAYQLKLLAASVKASDDPRWDMRLKPRKRVYAFLETFVWNLGVYIGLWALAGFHWKMAAYLFAANYVGTSIGLWYITTNHLVNPMSGDHVDPLLHSTSVKLPGWVDFLHFKFSHHPEHHLYPTAGPAHYGRIREVLLAEFPERFNMLTGREVMRELLASPLVYLDSDTLVSADGGGARSVRCLPLAGEAEPGQAPKRKQRQVMIVAGDGQADWEATPQILIDAALVGTEAVAAALAGLEAVDGALFSTEAAG